MGSIARQKTPQAPAHSADPALPTGPDGVALAPPAYGIEVADRQPIQCSAAPATTRDSAPAVPPPNRTGLPDGLKTGVEALSGIALDDVRVHFNSSRPAQLQALAYTQGSEIHVAPGQERHLPHEAWHVVQQKQGRVRATMQLKGTAINDDAGLEREAEVMGARALDSGAFFRGVPEQQKRLQRKPLLAFAANQHIFSGKGAHKPGNNQGKEAITAGLTQTMQHQTAIGRLVVLQYKRLEPDKLNVVGEDHGEETKLRRSQEELITEEELGDDASYWTESQFKDFDDFLTKAPSSEDVDRIPQADPVYLLVAYAIHAINEEYNLKQLTEEYTTHQGDQREALHWAAHEFERIRTEFNQLDYYLPKVSKDGEQRDYVPKWMIGAIDLVIGNIEQWKEIFYHIVDEFPTNTGVSVSGELIEQLDRYYSLLDRISAPFRVPFDNSRDVAWWRSIAMHQAANDNYFVEGVWKIGYEHVNDIRQFGELLEIKYNLLSRDEFVEAYANYFG